MAIIKLMKTSIMFSNFLIIFMEIYLRCQYLCIAEKEPKYILNHTMSIKSQYKRLECQ